MRLDLALLKVCVAAIVGAGSAIVSVTIWVSDKTNRIEAHEAAIERLHDGESVTADRLISIDQRLSRIEGKLDMVIRGQYH